MLHITLQQIEIAIGVFQAYSGRFPMEVQDILQNIWREKIKILEEVERREKEEREKLTVIEEEAEEKEKKEDEVEDLVQETIDSLSLSELAKE